VSDIADETEYLRGIEHFNAREFFEAHDAWEALWTRTHGPSRLFYKGLIHAAVALHHFGNGNLRGARKLLASCVRYLTPYTPRYLGLDVQAFLTQMQRCFAELVDGSSRSAGVQLDARHIPFLTLDPPPNSYHGRSHLTGGMTEATSGPITPGQRREP